MSIKQAFVLAGIAGIALGAGNHAGAGEPGLFSARGEASVEKELFGRTADGKPAHLYTLRNTLGMIARITDYGGAVVSLTAPDKDGRLADVVLGYDTLGDYEKGKSYFGCIVGRCSNRIAGGKFRLAGKEYTLTTNDGKNHLHGGFKGFNKVVWDGGAAVEEGEPRLTLKYLSKDGEEGYPGNLSASVVYTFTNDGALKIESSARTDKPTIISLSHHSYFNLAGTSAEALKKALSHKLMINAERFTPINAEFIPTGELLPVKGTPFDFTKPTAIGLRIGSGDEQLKFGLGYDHNFVLNKEGGRLSLAARVHEPESGRVMEVLTSEPGLQFYSGNFLNGNDLGKDGAAYPYRSAFCLEPQRFPDSPNQPAFPSVVLEPGKEYSSVIVYRFSAKRARR